MFHRSLGPTLSLLGLGLLLVAPLSADAAVRVDGKPKVTFFGIGSPGFLDIEGVTNTMTAAEDAGKLVFTVPMSTVQTGISMRDSHMNEKYVEVAKFPNAILSFPKADVLWPATLGEEKKGTVKATFNIHGQDQAVNVAYAVKKSKTGFQVKANFNYDTSVAGIAIPSYLGVTVDPKMRAEVAVDLIDG